MIYSKLAVLAFAALIALPVFADGVVDDAITLTNGNAGEDVIVAWAERQQSGGTISVEDILKLKANKVPDRAIATLIRNGALKAAPVPAQYIARDESGRLVERSDAQPQQQQQQYTQPTQQYVAQPATYVQPVYASASPVYYSSGYSYPYYSSYYSPSVSIGFGYYGGSRYGYGGYYGSGYGYGGYYGGYRGGHHHHHGGYRGGHHGGGHSVGHHGGGFRGGFGGSGYTSGFSTRRGGRR